MSTIGDWLTHSVGRVSAGKGIRIEDEVRTYADLATDAERVATGLLDLGLSPGERVVVLGRASIGAVQAWFGLAKAGLIEVPVNPASGPVLLRYYLEQSAAAAIICDPEFVAVVEGLSSGLPALRQRIVLDGPALPGWRGFDDLLAYAPGVLPSVKATDAAVILYTSGTTGAPKGALLSHRANVNLARHTVGLMGYTAEDRLYSVFPLYHSNARYTTVMAGIDAGADVVMHRRFSASRFWDICREHRITAFNYQGAMMSILHKQPPRSDDADNPVRAAFGAPCPAEIFADMERRFGIELTEIYGSTEVSIICDMPPSRRRVGTAGTESVNYEVAVVDERDERVPAGTPGEIVTRPKRPGWMFDGYFANPAATADSWRNLWFHTGDRGVLDSDGFLTFLDRMKDTIRRRGENISTWEIERVVGECGDVAQVAAYGVDSELSEEDVMIAVVPAAGVRPDPAGLLEHCRARLTGFAVPRYVRIVPALPMTPSQRVEKYKLRAEGVTADTFDVEAETMTREASRG